VKRRTLLVVLAAVIVLPLLAVAVGTWFGSNPRRPKASASFMALPFSGSTPQCLPTPGAALSLTAGGIEYHSANNLGPVACLAFEPGQPTTLTFRNLDGGVHHNVHIVRGPRMYSFNPPTLFLGRIINGPRTVVYRIPALPAGLWTFHCDLHPDQMIGSVVVPVTVSDAGFQPESVEVTQGFAMAWTTPAGQHHEVKDASNVYGGSFDSGDLEPRGYSFRFFAAATYPLLDPTDGRRSQVVVPMIITHDLTAATGTFRVQWAFDTIPPEFSADVQVMRPNATTWSAFDAPPRPGRIEWTPDAGGGIYRFRARFRRVKGGAASGWSPPSPSSSHEPSPDYPAHAGGGSLQPVFDSEGSGVAHLRSAPTPSLEPPSPGMTRMPAPVPSAARTNTSMRLASMGSVTPWSFSTPGDSATCEGSGPNHEVRSSPESLWTRSTSTWAMASAFAVSWGPDAAR